MYLKKYKGVILYKLCTYLTTCTLLVNTTSDLFYTCKHDNRKPQTMQHCPSRQLIVDMITRYKNSPTNFMKGEEYIYSNTKNNEEQIIHTHPP